MGDTTELSNVVCFVKTTILHLSRNAPPASSASLKDSSSSPSSPSSSSSNAYESQYGEKQSVLTRVCFLYIKAKQKKFKIRKPGSSRDNKIIPTSRSEWLDKQARGAVLTFAAHQQLVLPQSVEAAKEEGRCRRSCVRANDQIP